MGGKASYQFSFSRKLLTFMAAGVTFAFILVFTLGFIVGKGLRENQQVRKSVEDASESRRDEKDRIPPMVKSDLEKDPSDLELTFYKTLISKEGSFSAPAREVKKSSQIAKREDQREREERGKGVFKKENERAGSPNGYTLQVGSFQNKEQAEKLANKLKRKGYEVYVVSSNIPMKGVWHRVRVGHFETLQEAKKFGLTIEMKERLPIYVTFSSQ
ncbi:MAG: SPOR domain-containing protein [Pseudomonadota bacterium]